MLNVKYAINLLAIVFTPFFLYLVFFYYNISAAVCAIVFIPSANKISAGPPTRGRLLGGRITFYRKSAKKYMPK